MNEQILEIVGKLLAAIVVGLVGYLAPKFNKWLEEKTSRETSENVMLMVRAFVRAADQMFKAEDPDGSIRNAYVKDQLKALGVAITAEVNAYIESEVFALNKKEAVAND